MSTTRIKDKLSKLVGSQLPEFVQSDYQTFVSFVTAYYEFLEQDQNAQELLQNSRDYNDIDKTIDSFIENFAKQYLSNIPRELLGDKRLLVKKINDLYSSKGSENSYNLLFQLLFGKQVKFLYPGEQVLRASDGKWIQRTSIFVEIIYGNSDDLSNRDCRVINSKYISSVPIKEKRTVIASIPNSEITSSQFAVSGTQFEYFFDNINNPTISEGDLIQADGVLGRVIPSPTKVTVVDGGKLFKIGDIIDVEILRGTGTRLKVIKLNPGGNIKNVQIIDYGINYPDFFYYNYSPTVVRDVLAEAEILLPSINLYDRTVGVKDEGYVNKFDYVDSSYLADLNYVGDVVSTFKYDEGQFRQTTTGSSEAIFYIEKGIKNFYPGYFNTIDGFLSDDIYLEDEAYYQPYSYVLQIDEQLSKYKKAVMDILHPAGMKLNAEYLIGVDINLQQIVTTTLSFVLNDFYDFVPIQESLSYLIEKPFSNVASAVETAVLEVNKALNSANSANDSNVFYSLNKNITSANVVNDSNVFYSFSKALESANVVNDSNVFFSLSTSVLSSNAAVDSGTLVLLDYVEETYFDVLDPYVGTSTAFN